MNPLRTLLFITTLSALEIVPVSAQEKAATVMVKGEVVDIKCYLEKGEDGKGKTHKECAVRCANQGVPLAVLEDETNNLYYTVKVKGGSNANDMLLPFVAEKVLVKGKIVKKGGTQLLLIKSVEKTE
jgi:hypothetical protein